MNAINNNFNLINMKKQSIEIIWDNEDLIAKLDTLSQKFDLSISIQNQILEQIKNSPVVVPPIEVPVEPTPIPVPVDPIPEPTPVEPIPVEPEPIPEVPPITEQPVDSVSIIDLGVEPIDSQIGNLPFRGVLYEDKKKESGDGYWLLYGSSPSILKVSNGLETTEVAKGWIGKEDFLNLDLSDKNVYFPKGTYLLLQGAGVNPFWYQKTKSIIGDATLIGVMNEDYQAFCRIATDVRGLKLINIITDFNPQFDRDVIFNDTTIELEDLQTSMNPITGLSTEADLVADNVTIKSKARIRAGFFIANAKNLSIKNSNISAKYADNGIRIARVVGSCEITGNTTGEGFNTGIQASSNRDGLSIGYNIENNHIINVLEESLGYDSYANNLYLVPVIVTSKISAVESNYVELDKLYFIDEIQAGVSYGKKEVDVSFVGDATRYLMVIQSGELNYRTFNIEKYEITPQGKLRIYSSELNFKLLGAEVSICSGFKKCNLFNNRIDGFIPDTGQPAHGISLWGGGFYNTVTDNVVKGSKNGLQLASLGAFGVDEFFCHAIGNVIENNQFIDCQSAIKITSEYSNKLGSENKFTQNIVKSGDVIINNQLNFEMVDNYFENNTILIENVSGVFSGGKLVNSVVKIKNCPNLKVGYIEIVGNSKINYI
jgi:hypothetical protein